MKFNPNDIVLTPDKWAADIIEHFKPEGVTLDPCRGEGAFYNKLTGERLWCEITEGVDFFQFNKPVNWIVSNPPYSTFGPWLDHSLTLAENIVYLIPVNKIFSSATKLRKIQKWGGIPHIRYYGSGRDMGFPFGFAVGAVHLQRGYSGPIQTSWHADALANDNSKPDAKSGDKTLKL